MVQHQHHHSPIPPQQTPDGGSMSSPHLHPVVPVTAIKDEAGNTYLIDRDLDHYFVGGHSYQKTIHLRNGIPCVSDFATRIDTGEQTKWVTLATWLFEAAYEMEVRGGYEIVQITPGKNYTISNLQRVKKEKRAAAA